MNTKRAKSKNPLFDSLKSLGLLIDEDQKEQYIQAFIKDIENGLQKKETSLDILPSYIQLPSKITSHGKFGVLELGKVNLSKAYCEINDGGVSVYGVKRYPIPGLNKSISKKQFYEKIIFEARDVLRTVDKIGICVRHSIEAQPNGDGKLLGWAREKIKADELVNSLIGEDFEKYLYDEFEEKKKVVVLNDTIATLMAGASKTYDQEFDDFFGLIHSLGYNLSYLEKASNLKNVTDVGGLKGDIAINLQAGSFDKVKRSEIADSIDKALGEEHVSQFSKLVNLKCFIITLRQLVSRLDDEFLGEDIKKKILKIDDLELHDIYRFQTKGLRSTSKLSEIFRDASLEEAKNLSLIIDFLLQRVAKLVSLQICALLEYKGVGKNPIQPVGIVIESEFWEIIRDFEYRVRCEMHKYFKQSDPRFVSFLNIMNASLMGAGVAASID